ncbi:MAG: hypothetical protein LLG04_12855, partial [Parachlamydia sp.]|nr:hypothetical protein [Parachlamydia sp.]
GISSSTQHYDLFEMIRRPNLNKDNRPPDPPPRELLSKQKKLEKEIEKKFRESRKKDEGSGSNVLAGLIRILFLALILPPYILLYRIPKFLFVDWVVKLANAIDNYFARIGKAIQQAYERQKMKIRNAFVGFWELIKATFRKKMSAAPHDVDEPMSFLAFVAEGIVGLYRITLYPLIRASVTSWQFAKRSAQAIREFPLRLHLAIQDTLKRIQQMRDRILTKAQKYLHKTKEAIANRTIRPVSRWIDRQVEALIALHHRVIAKLKKMVQAILFAIRHPIQTSLMIVEGIRTHSNRAYKSFEQAIKQWQESKKQAILAQWQRVRTWYEQNIASPVRTRWNAIKSQIQAWVDRVTAPFVKIWVALRKYAEAVRSKITHTVNHYLEKPQAWMNKQKKALKAIYEPFKKTFMAWYTRIQDRLSQRMEKIKKVLSALSEPFVWASKELWSVLKPLVDPFIRFYQRTQVYADALSYRLRLLAAWMVVLTRYGMEMVRGTTEKLWNHR